MARETVEYNSKLSSYDRNQVWPNTEVSCYVRLKQKKLCTSASPHKTCTKENLRQPKLNEEKIFFFLGGGGGGGLFQNYVGGVAIDKKADIYYKKRDFPEILSVKLEK